MRSSGLLVRSGHSRQSQKSGEKQASQYCSLQNSGRYNESMVDDNELPLPEAISDQSARQMEDHKPLENNSSKEEQKEP